MTSALLGWNAVLTGDVRANGAYRLRSLASLTERHRRSLESLGVNTSEVFGVLVSRAGSRLPDKVVDHAAADLFSMLERAGRAPPEIGDRLAELVFDGVLEIEGPTGFVSGPMAYETVRQEHEPGIGGGRLGELSRAALDYAERLGLTNPDNVTARLYGYHRIPLSRRWTRSYPDAAAVLDTLPERVLSKSWVGPAESKQSHWLSWARKDPQHSGRPSRFPYKLYVSPRVEDLPEVLPTLVDALTASSAPLFKIGADAAGLLRPDKIVVYLGDASETVRVAQAVNDALDGICPHGVPFSAELGGDGLLSWGGDPPRDAAPIGRRAESWRLSVCRRLAEYLVTAQRAPVSSARPVDFALARLGLDGVDVRSFAPAGLAAPCLATQPRGGS